MYYEQSHEFCNFNLHEHDTVNTQGGSQYEYYILVLNDKVGPGIRIQSTTRFPSDIPDWSNVVSEEV